MIAVLRLGERPQRDHRINTHLALVARAFGANKLIMFFRDPSIFSSMDSIQKRFGGSFRIEVQNTSGWKKIIRNWNGIIVHLTMYGMPLDKGIEMLRDMISCSDNAAGVLKDESQKSKTEEMEDPEKPNDILVVLGGEKVPAEVYQLAHFNIGIGNQPHSEVAALAVFLDRLNMGEELNRQFPDHRFRIVPQERGKKMIENP